MGLRRPGGGPSGHAVFHNLIRRVQSWALSSALPRSLSDFSVCGCLLTKSLFHDSHRAIGQCVEVPNAGTVLPPAIAAVATIAFLASVHGRLRSLLDSIRTTPGEWVGVEGVRLNVFSVTG